MSTMTTGHAAGPFVTAVKITGHGVGNIIAVAITPVGHALGHIVEALDKTPFTAAVSIPDIHRIVHRFHPSFLYFGT
ncbi:MAG: hypothetical protein IJI71_04200 [Clostridia bacterium]|nr:hypothetical protein [Clostridia bacterium]